MDQRNDTVTPRGATALPALAGATRANTRRSAPAAAAFAGTAAAPAAGPPAATAAGAFAGPAAAPAAASAGAGLGRAEHSAEAATPWAVRRPPRADGELRERPARAVVPGWTALLVFAAALAGVILLAARRQGLPEWVPAAARLNDILGADRAPLPDTLAALLFGGCGLVALVALFGLMAGPVGTARVLTRWGGYRGTVRRTGLVWVNPLLKRHTVDVRVRHWRSEPITTADREGSPIRAEVLLVWAVRDTARARFATADHRAYLAAAAEAALCRIAATLPCDSFASPGPSLRDGQWLGGELTRLLAAEAAPVGIAVYSAQAVGLDYTEEFGAVLRRRRLAELDAGTREVIVGDALETAALTVSRLEHGQGLAFDDTARAGLVRELVTAFLTLPASGTAAEVLAPQPVGGSHPLGAHPVGPQAAQAGNAAASIAMNGAREV